ncbi:hypothetical protein [uncultured Thiodictyon sp.]|uniref:hypothetical protein n=1 Tax=uncultured Thiodictyon sp. TaxID=1846217 RepID=UPI0025DB4554|nr:hypothetical protein [uncultured Thiodictyon sp.]
MNANEDLQADAWLYTPEMRERLAQADTWMKSNPPRESDLEQLAAKLDAAGMILKLDHQSC